MIDIKTDVHITGAGLIGLFTALVLNKNGYDVVISEKDLNYNNRATQYDNRTVAISEGTKKFLEKQDFWKSISEDAQPIEKIEVIDREKTDKLNFLNKIEGSKLGYIIKNQTLSKKIIKRLMVNKNFKIIIDDNKINQLEIKNSFIVSSSVNRKIHSDLIVAADGKNSSIKNILKISSYKKNYNKNALVLCFEHTNSHNNTAYEYFYDSGPLAILPMKKENKNFCSSIVWTLNKNYSSALMDIPNERLIEILNKKVEKTLGRIKKIKSKKIFPLSAHLNSKFYSNRVIFVGDSAHSVHPIAGQGWNLGMRDVKAIDFLSKKYKGLGIELGTNEFCKEYHDNCFYDAYRLYQITDKFDTIFKSNNLFVSSLRSQGFRFISKRNNLKNFITDFAMGV
ncbi:FAD-dependent monooxygenase [Pelagibacteraceae bacterium]|nr:FAD-dependent monooxygenase [Pelagibacteraceae bacterium]